MLLFNVVLMAFTYAVLRLQGILPGNPQGLAGLSPHFAFNTAVSFTTNTKWQSYAGESTMSNLSQMLGLTIHDFLSAATGVALAFALFRGFARRSASTIGNFWADATRVTLYLLLPISVVYALFLIASGVPQSLAATINVDTLEGARQVLVTGPVASQEAIKMLGTNGGGFFNANSAHPFENPTALTNFVQMPSIFLIGFGLTWTFGKAVGNTRQGWAILSAMIILFLAGVTVTSWQEAAGNPWSGSSDSSTIALLAGRTMEVMDVAGLGGDEPPRRDAGGRESGRERQPGSLTRFVGQLEGAPMDA